MKDLSKNDFSVLKDDFYNYLHESMKVIYGAENIIIFGRNIVINKPSIDVEYIISLFKKKVNDGGYVFRSSRLKEYATHLPLNLDEFSRLEKNILLHF